MGSRNITLLKLMAMLAGSIFINISLIQAHFPRVFEKAGDAFTLLILLTMGAWFTRAADEGPFNLQHEDEDDEAGGPTRGFRFNMALPHKPSTTQTATEGSH